MANWIYQKEELRVMTDAELRELVMVTPLKDDYNEKERIYGNTSRLLFQSSLEKNRRQTLYKNGLKEFKRVSVNADGSKAKMNAEIRACKERKEYLYRLLKDEKEDMKFLEREYELHRREQHQAEYRYRESMECFVSQLLSGRERERMIRAAELRIERQHRYEEYQARLPIVKENVKRLTLEELEAPMDDVCIICMDTHAVKDTLLTCCGHRFGRDCFKMWHNQRSIMNMCMNCPMCKNYKNLSVTKYEEIEVVDLVY
jgi:hypothetical protein